MSGNSRSRQSLTRSFRPSDTALKRLSTVCSSAAWVLKYMNPAQPGSLPVRAIDARTVSTVSWSSGFMMGISRPPMNAMARKLRFRVPRSGSPNDTFDRPTVVSTPNSLRAVRVFMVILAYCWFDEMAITSPSKTSRRRSMPMLSARSMMRFAISIRASAVSGTPRSSSGRVTDGA